MIDENFANLKNFVKLSDTDFMQKFHWKWLIDLILHFRHSFHHENEMDEQITL